MKDLVLALYVVSAISSAAVWRLILISKNGGLKKALLFLFGAITFSLLARFISGWFKLDRELTSLTLMIPFTVAIVWFAVYLYLHHKKE